MGQIDDDIMNFDPWDTDREDDRGPPPILRCKYCGDEDVYWGQDGTGRWALYNLNSRKHVCKDGIVSAIHTDAFDNLDE